jgi:hypothetical protein
MTLRPGTAGEVLKWKTMLTLLKFVKLSAGVPLTMKSVGWILLGSVGSLKPTEKSTGGEFITLPQVGLVMITKQTDGVGVGLGGTVEVGVAVAVAVPVGVTTGVGVDVAVAVPVGVTIGVGVDVAVAVPVGVTIGVAVAVAVAVPVGVTIGVAVGVAVEVAVAVGVGVGVPPPEMRNAYTLLSFAT